MYFSEIDFVSGKREMIVFADQEEADDFYHKIVTYKTDRVIVNNNEQEMLMNMLNIETATKPKKYKEKED